MPRRRKKSAQQRKPSLIFTDSPVNIQTHVPSPVLCARHPPTAKSVSVFELEDMPWVSPQFRGTSSSDGRRGRRRITRQRRKSTGMALSMATVANNNKENTQCGNLIIAGNKNSNRYKRLKFVGEQFTIPSLAEDVDISCDTETAEDEPADDIAKISDIETSCDDLDPALISSRLNKENDTSIDPFSSDTNANNSSTPVRRSRRLAANLRHLLAESSPVGKMSRTSKVLAPDTPDSEKGLTIRQRQLKGLI